MIWLFGSKDLHRTTVAMDDAAERLEPLLPDATLPQCGVRRDDRRGDCGLSAFRARFYGALLAALLRFVPYIGASSPGAAGGACGGGRSGLDDGAADAGFFLCSNASWAKSSSRSFMATAPGCRPSPSSSPRFSGRGCGADRPDPVDPADALPGRARPARRAASSFFDVLLGDRPALTPIENFYQRMLAGDPDEAHGAGRSAFEGALAVRPITTRSP